MGQIANIAEFFLISLGFGMGFFNNIAPSKLTGEGFQKLVNTVCLVSTFAGVILHALMGNPFGSQAISYAIGAISFLLIRQLHQEVKTPLMWALYGIHCLAGLSVLYFFQAQNLVNASFLLTSAVYLGVITYAMVLGHYYLVVPKLSEEPLKTSLKLMWALLAVKLVWSSIVTAGAGEFLSEYTTLGGGYAFNWMMLLMRYIWGYVIIFVMSVFTWKLVCMRSIQSATGILYAMTIFVFIGEIISSYLFFSYGMLI